MNSPPDLPRAFEHARELQRAGRLTEAEQAYRRLASAPDHRETALTALVELYLHARLPGKAIDALMTLTEEVPARLYYYVRLAELLDGLGRTDAAIGHYLRFLKREPGSAAAHFNLALLYKKNKRYGDALAAYETALRLGIDRPQEAYSNIGVLYSEMRSASRAHEMYCTISSDWDHLVSWDGDHLIS